MPAFLILLSITVVFGWVAAKLFHGLRTMEIQMGVGVALRRSESPLLFWAVPTSGQHLAVARRS
jgi:hypothetical protein